MHVFGYASLNKTPAHTCLLFQQIISEKQNFASTREAIVWLISVEVFVSTQPIPRQHMKLLLTFNHPIS